MIQAYAVRKASTVSPIPPTGTPAMLRIMLDFCARHRI